ncbi:MAG: Cysteine rich repeat [Alphaproteobacteria bacterium]|jgi:hypothetical protein|nr:Cysteine rich repeat [Alphaproteobacteria bacterium]MEA2990649.1 Cysteine rich repeat [Alphaproteobacteria bacterium]
MIRMTCLVLALMFAALGTASAELRNACADDRDKLCPGVQPGEGRVIACLVKVKDKLSPACIKLLQDVGSLPK